MEVLQRLLALDLRPAAYLVAEAQRHAGQRLFFDPLGRPGDLPVGILAGDAGTEVDVVRVAGHAEVAFLAHGRNLVAHDVEAQEPEHLGLLEVQLVALGAPEAGLHEQAPGGNGPAPAGLACPAEAPRGHLGGGLQVAGVGA